MRTKVALLATALSLGVFVAVLVHAVWYAPDIEIADSAVPTTTVVSAVPAGKPEMLEIPTLSIDAKVQDVGIAVSGNIGVPNNFTDVAWYKYGPEPGATGSAVIDGHVDNAISLPGVFKHLSDIAVGDDIYVDTASSTRLHFVVSNIEVYPYQSVPMTEVLSTTGSPRLALITCDGTWEEGVKSYNERLVVYANLVS
jgi:sortase A